MIRRPTTHRNSQIDCPTCVALAGERCITKDNHSFSCAADAHPARVRAAKAKLAAQLAEKIRLQGEAKVLRETRRFACTNPDTMHFLKAYKRLCRQYKTTLALGPGSHMVRITDPKDLEDSLKRFDKLCVKESQNG